MSKEVAHKNDGDTKRRRVDDNDSAPSDIDITSPDTDALAFPYIATSIYEIDKQLFITYS